MSLFSMLDDIKETLRPDPAARDVREEVLVTINAELEKRGVHARAVPGGSVAKGTFLRGDHDIDVFVRFSLDYSSEEQELPDIVEEVLAYFKPVRIHGSRDYFQFSHRGFDFEVVPVLAVDSAAQARNVTDMSPLHVEYFLDHGKGLEDEVRLAKQFCKSAKVYGAESYIRGFSGHVIDLLIIHYGSFYDLIKAAARWKAPVIIDMEGHHDDALAAIDTAKHSPLIIVDPVQPARNAAAALSDEQFAEFSVRCQEFLKDPSDDFFVVESFDENALRSRLSDATGAAVIVRANHGPDDKKDVAGAKVRKAFERLLAAYDRSDFTVSGSGWHFVHNEPSLMWFVIDEHSLPRLEERMGPPISAKLDAERFRKTHEEVTEREGRLWTKTERTLRVPEQLPGQMRSHLSDHLGVQILTVERVDRHGA